MMTREERFWIKVDRRGADECWNWQGFCQPRGHGQFWTGGRSCPAYRYSYELARGSIPHGLEIDHVCRNPRCVNPAHLEAVTHQENMQRAAKHQFGANNRVKTHCPRGHEYTPSNTYTWKTMRRCRVCRSAQQRTQYSRLKLAEAGQ